MALSNDLKVLTWIAKKSLQFLIMNMPFIKCGTSEYQPDFDNREYAKGDNIQIRRANRRVGGEGATIALDGVVEKTEYLTIEKQFNDGMVFTTKEMALFQTGEYGMEDYANRYILPSVLRTVSQVNSYIAQRAEQDLYHSYGTVGSPINSAGVLANIHARMEDLSMPVEQEKFLITTPYDGAQLKNSLVNYFNPAFNKGVGERYFLQQIMDFHYQATAGIKRHTTGLASGVATMTVKTDVSSGNSITITGCTASQTGYFLKGDIISVAGTYFLNPNTYQITTVPATFVVTADANSDAGGDCTVTVSPEVIIDPTNPWRNFSAKLAATSPVVVVASHNVNVAFVKGGLSYAAPRMQKMWTPYCVDMTDTEFGTGISLRLSRGADITNDQNILRFDLLFGAKFHPEYGVRIVT